MKFLCFLSFGLAIVSAAVKHPSQHTLVAIENEDEVFCEYDEGCEKDGSRLNLASNDENMIFGDDYLGEIEDFPSFVEENDLQETTDWPDSSFLLETEATPIVEYKMPLETVLLQFNAEESEEWPEDPNLEQTLAGEPISLNDDLETVLVEIAEEGENVNPDLDAAVFLEYEMTEISNIDSNLMATNAELVIDLSGTVIESVSVQSDDDMMKMDSHLDETGAGEFYANSDLPLETVMNEVYTTESLDADSEISYPYPEVVEVSAADSEISYPYPEVVEVSAVDIDEMDPSDSNLDATGAVMN